jgi:hypothetical protein
MTRTDETQTQLDAPGAVDILLPFFDGDLAKVDQMLDDTEAALRADGGLTDRSKGDLAALRAEVGRRRDLA